MTLLSFYKDGVAGEDASMTALAHPHTWDTRPTLSSLQAGAGLPSATRLSWLLPPLFLLLYFCEPGRLGSYSAGRITS